MPPSETYPNFQGDLLNVMLIGDDMQGYCFGFDKSRGFALIEVDPRGTPQDIAEHDFLSFVAAYLLNEE